MRRLIARYVTFLACFVALLAPVALASPAAAAYNPLGNCGQNSPAADSAVCQSEKTAGDDPLTGPDGLLIKATRIVALIAGFAAVLIIALAGVRYITSSGAADQISQAKKTIIYASVGIIVIIIGQAVISYIISRI